MAQTVSRPGEGELAEFHRGYLAAIPDATDAVALLERQRPIIDALAALPPESAAHRYADGKWSVREVIGHLSDAERVFAYRLLRIARGDETPLPGFDEQKYVPTSGAEARDVRDLAAELAAIRTSTLMLIRSLPEPALLARGVVNGWPVSARGVAFVVAGHFQHHVAILRERYGLSI